MEVIVMNNNKQPNKTSVGTNAASNKFGTEFASETDVQAVKQQNAQAEAKKNKQSSQQ
ncbi:gamma-type small acid-soluble spore protein [Bacillus thuringiensis]|uniref:Small, acid-soluble spore protein gamma-type n=2 Tax=Bacillus thuringiensis TaxID=1428 RepID=A0A9X6TU82_BACTU|nr:gamma-type small acid-soluble spore protein [Bacillus thuringiensis]PED10590.1 gamma-type small acid-soluble spore protein [Bacillus thuringiensis]PEF87597.1 gamma-type small acid-soluble spore protein [Bacillus thuringiensis]PES52314.1 gamma-type small acid-soluble spore protein [Bacillus thuringiensis]PFC23677.1 gamma-type small acid-soluble spore protein [Bacillus thuringiensis]PFS59241.1 gamma-type small acid-soluble spore protein [Bacillus thuringiensis]